MEIAMPRYLQKRRRVWYAILEIPKSLKPQFGGKARLVKSLKTESLSEAERRVFGVIAIWKEIIEAKRTGQPSGDAIKALQLQAEEMKLRGYENYEIKAYQEDLGDVFDDDDLRNAAAEMHGSDVSFMVHINEYILATSGTDKTKDMKASDLRRFAKKFA